MAVSYPTSKEEADKQSLGNVIVVRHLTRVLYLRPLDKVVKDYIDLYPKFCRSDWNLAK